MKESARLSIQGTLRGIAAALVYLALSLLVRTAFGIGTIIELLGDRTAPMFGIPLFFRLLNTFGGYSHLKQAGVVAIVLSEVICGAVVGVSYALVAHSRGNKIAQRLVAVVVGVATVLLAAGLWPNLGMNFNGLPPDRAIVASIVTLGLLSAAYVAVLFWLTDRNQSAAERGDEVERRRWLLTGTVSAVAALVSAVLLGRFYRLASYSYDGSVNTGDDLPPVTPNDKFYQVTKNQVDPRPTLKDWSLEIGGSVLHPRLLKRADLDEIPSVVQETTLAMHQQSDRWRIEQQREVERCAARYSVAGGGPLFCNEADYVSRCGRICRRLTGAKGARPAYASGVRNEW